MALISQEVFDRIPTAVIVVDDKRRILQANKAALELVGINAPGRDLALNLRHPSVLDGLDRVLKGAPEAEGEYTLPVPVSRSMSAIACSILESSGFGLYFGKVMSRLQSISITSAPIMRSIHLC